MKGWTIEGQEVKLLPHQEATVKALLAEGEMDLYFGGRGWGRSVIIATAYRYDLEYVQNGIPLPWGKVNNEKAKELAAGVRTAQHKQNQELIGILKKYGIPMIDQAEESK
jgi:hypothetical protein